MDRDQSVGWTIFLASVAGIIIYGYLLIVLPQLVLQITAFVAVAVILGILAWIGWTMATTPPPAPIETEVPGVSPEPAASPTQTTEPEQKK